MNCANFEKRLNDLLDRREPLHSDFELIKHAERCPACGHVLSASQALFDGLKFGEIPETRGNFAADVVHRAGLHPAAAEHRFSYTSLAMVAAVFLFALVPLLTEVRIREHRTTTNRVVATGTEKSEKTTAGNASLRDLTMDSPSALKQSPEPVEVDELNVMLGQLAATATDVSVESLSSVGQFGASLEPIATSLSVALDTLRNTISPARSPAVKTQSTDSARLDKNNLLDSVA